MEANIDRTGNAVMSALDRDLRLVDGAIAMVAAGGAPRVIVAGLRLGEAVIDVACARALHAGVRLVPLWRVDESGLDVAVERIG